MTKVVIVLMIEGQSSDAYEAVSNALDQGSLQDAVNAHEGVEVQDAIMFAGNKDASANLRQVLKRGFIGSDKFLP